MPMDRVEKYAHSPRRIFEWFWYSFMYFEAAKALADVYRASHARDAYLPPLIYNLRHGIELMLKFLGYALGIQQNKLSDHNIQIIFAAVKESVLGLDDDSLSFAASGIGVEKETIALVLQYSAGRVQKLTDKYYGYRFLAVPVEDRNNELFRYPATTMAGPFDTTHCHDRLTANEILADAKTLTEFLLFVVGAFARNERGMHIYDEIIAAVQPEPHQSSAAGAQQKVQADGEAPPPRPAGSAGG